MSTKRFLAKLEELSQLKKNWYSVAETFEALKENCSGMAHANRRLRDGCEASGYNLNTLNRMVAVKTFFDSAKSNVKDLKDVDPNTLSFPSLEVVKRAHQVNPGEGAKLLAEVANGQITYRDLRERYKDIFSANPQGASAHQLAKQEAKFFEQKAFESIAEGGAKLFGIGTECLINKPSSISWPVDAVGYVKGADGKDQPLVGFKCVILKNPNEPRERLERLIQSTLFHANFFKNYWVVFSSTTGRERIALFSDILDLLHVESIGIAILPWDEENQNSEQENKLEILRRPKRGPVKEWQGTLPEYQKLYSQLCRANPG